MTWPLEWDRASRTRSRAVAGPRVGPSLASLADVVRARRDDPAAPRPTPRPAGADWYRIGQPKAQADGTTTVEMAIYDEIGWWGVTAADFCAELGECTADQIDLRLSSPGGDVFDGLAIYNALVDHPANVIVYVDGLAASIASVIAQSGDRVIMGPQTQMMIHDAWGVQVGNADDMREMAELLDRHSLNIAEVYAQRSGQGTAEEWRETMKAEAWYNGDEAVEAGLADEAKKRGKRGEAGEKASAPRQFDLSRFRFQGRDAAPAPTIRPAARHAPPHPDSVGGPGADSLGGGAGSPGPAPSTEPDPWADLPDDVFAGLGATLSTSITEAGEEPFEWDAEAFRAGLEHDANHAPATPEVAADPTTTASEAPSWRTFTDALMEALTP